MMHEHDMPITTPIGCSHNMSPNKKTFDFITSFNAFIISSTGESSGSSSTCAFSHTPIAVREWFTYMAITFSFFLRTEESLVYK
eukprot:11713816-Ditylum_brightwellii.AAC.1